MQEINNAKQESSAQDIVKPVGDSPMLVVLCGPSHAGKTRFARRFRDEFTIISPDKIRKQLSVNFGDSKDETKVWDIYESMKRKALEKGDNIILDACHMSKRARWHSLQEPNAKHRRICIVFDLPFQTIRERCFKVKRVSLGEVKRMWKDFQDNKPTTEELKREGFDEVHFIRREDRPVRIARLDWRKGKGAMSTKGGVLWATSR